MSIRKGNNIIAGNPSIESVANVDLSNLSSNGKHYVAFKGYDSTTSYSLNDVVVSIQNNEVKIYQSLSDNNTSSLSDTTKWKEVEFGGTIDIDGNTITLNSNDEIQAIGVIDSSDSTTAIKLWTGTRAEYDAITTKDANTLYNITDDTGSDSVLANTNLSNLTETGENHFANPALTNSQYTTNRILEIPQDIKLELNNGTLTLKAGSKVYDGNSNSFSITSDITKSGLAGGDVQQLLLLKIDGTTLISVGVTDTNFAYNSSTGYVHSNTYGDYYLPIALTSHNTGTGAYTSIDQIFNGFGYIGSTVFILPGVKVQVPNGKNEDGTYACTIYTNTSVSASDGSYGNTNFNGSVIGGESWGRSFSFANVSNKKDIPSYSNCLITSENVVYQNINGTLYEVSITNLADYTITAGKITAFTPNNVDSVANSNASNFSQAGRSYLSSLGYPSDRYIDLTVLASDSNYTAPANGWFLTRWGSSASTLRFIQFRNPDAILRDIKYYSGTVGSVAVVSTYARKGQVITMRYDGNPSTECAYFRFYYAEGEEN